MVRLRSYSSFFWLAVSRSRLLASLMWLLVMVLPHTYRASRMGPVKQVEKHAHQRTLGCTSARMHMTKEHRATVHGACA